MWGYGGVAFGMDLGRMNSIVCSGGYTVVQDNVRAGSVDKGSGFGLEENTVLERGVCSDWVCWAHVDRQLRRVVLFDFYVYIGDAH